MILHKSNIFLFVLVILSLLCSIQSIQLQQSQNGIISQQPQLDPSQKLKVQIDSIVNERKLRGIQIEIANNSKPIFYYNQGPKNSMNQPIDNNTIFTLASMSKSFSAVAIMQLVQKGLMKLTDKLTDLLGFEVKNPYFPNIPITVEMLLSHQSSISQTQPQYSQFINDTQNSKDGTSIPALRQILVPGGKYYNPNIFRADRKPGESFRYSNLGYLIAGTIIEIVSKTRFDIYQKQNILDFISQGQIENATFNPATIKNYKNLGTIYVGKQGAWVPSLDNYTGPIPQKNLTGYKIGTNGGIFGPSYNIKANMHHMNNYMYMFINKGVTKNGKRILSQKSVQQIIKPRYQYQGPGYIVTDAFRMYGLGIYTTSYPPTDTVIQHQVIRGHLGSYYGLISGYFYWKSYSFCYIINGGLNGFVRQKNSIYEMERILLNKAVNQFIVDMNTFQDNLIESRR